MIVPDTRQRLEAAVKDLAKLLVGCFHLNAVQTPGGLQISDV